MMKLNYRKDQQINHPEKVFIRVTGKGYIPSDCLNPHDLAQHHEPWYNKYLGFLFEVIAIDMSKIPYVTKGSYDTNYLEELSYIVSKPDIFKDSIGNYYIPVEKCEIVVGRDEVIQEMYMSYLKEADDGLFFW